MRSLSLEDLDRVPITERHDGLLPVWTVSDGLPHALLLPAHVRRPDAGDLHTEELLDGSASIDLSPYGIERFAGGAVFPEDLVL